MKIIIRKLVLFKGFKYTIDPKNFELISDMSFRNTEMLFKMKIKLYEIGQRWEVERIFENEEIKTKK